MSIFIAALRTTESARRVEHIIGFNERGCVTASQAKKHGHGGKKSTLHFFRERTLNKIETET